MKSTRVILIVLILLFLAGGAFVLSQKKAVQPQQVPVAEEKVVPTNANVFTSLQDALSKSISLQCDYSTVGGAQTTAYIKNGAVRVNTTGKTAAESANVIMKDKKVYFWNGTQGFMMAFDPAQYVATPSAAGQPGQNPGDVVKGLEQYKQYCKEASVDDSQFVVPTDVKFSDMSGYMKDATKSGATGGMTQEQIEEMQKMYQR